MERLVCGAPLKDGLNCVHFKGPFQANEAEQAKHPCVCTPHLFRAVEASSACWNRNPFDFDPIEFQSHKDGVWLGQVSPAGQLLEKLPW